MQITLVINIIGIYLSLIYFTSYWCSPPSPMLSYSYLYFYEFCWLFLSTLARNINRRSHLQGSTSSCPKMSSWLVLWFHSAFPTVHFTSWLPILELSWSFTSIGSSCWNVLSILFALKLYLHFFPFLRTCFFSHCFVCWEWYWTAEVLYRCFNAIQYN